MRPLTLFLVLAALVGGLAATPASAREQCEVAGSAHPRGVLIGGYCQPVSAISTGPSNSPKTKTIDCGTPSSRDNALWNYRCGSPRTCYTRSKATGGAPVLVDTFATLTYANGRWSDPQTWCPANATPGINQTALRERAIRLLPAVQIGSAWTTTALVNAETILWAQTRTDRPLASVTVAGQQVALRIHLTEAHWNYGDTTTETTSTPGTPYTRADPCHTAQCPHYRGHTYRNTGRMTITLNITWHAQYRTPTGPWTDIDDTITGPTTQHAITVKQARAILVPNPGQH
jgi:hypothetical protein